MKTIELNAKDSELTGRFWVKWTRLWVVGSGGGVEVGTVQEWRWNVLLLLL